MHVAQRIVVVGLMGMVAWGCGEDAESPPSRSGEMESGEGRLRP